MSIKAAFAKLKEAQPNTKSAYFQPGFYKVQIEKVLVKTSQTDGSLFFIVECKVLESKNSPIHVGTQCAQAIKITGNLSAMSNIKGFLAGALGLDKNDAEEMQTIDADMLESLVESEAMNGLVLNLTCRVVKTRKGSDFTTHDWSLVTDGEAKKEAKKA